MQWISRHNFLLKEARPHANGKLWNGTIGWGTTLTANGGNVALVWVDMMTAVDLVMVVELMVTLEMLRVDGNSGVGWIYCGSYVVSNPLNV